MLELREGSCYPEAVVGVNVGLACVDAVIAFIAFYQLFYHWHEQQIDGVYTSLLLVLYYFIGSSVPSAFVLLVMRELPPPLVINRRQESRTIAFIRDHSVAAHPEHWTATTSSLSLNECRSQEQARYEMLLCTDLELPEQPTAKRNTELDMANKGQAA
ncbi:UNVERIFIED_CONTAM: hypothetical protein Sindi_0008200 [Sesamum indicum]